MRQGLPSFCWVWDSLRIYFFLLNKSGKNYILTGIKRLLAKARSRLQHMMWSNKMRINLKERVMPRNNLFARIMTNSFKFSPRVTYSICQLNILQQKEKPRSQKPKVSLIPQVWFLKMEMWFLTNKRPNFQQMYHKRRQIYTMISTNRELILAKQKDDRKWRIVYRRQKTCFLCLKCKN